MTDCENGIEGVSLKEQLSGRRYDIEHALGMYALQLNLELLTTSGQKLN